MIVNKTPLRTSRNFKINHMELENIDLPENLQPFEYVEITNENADIMNIKREEFIQEVTYGIGKEFEQNIFKNANHAIKIRTCETPSNVQIVYTFQEDEKDLVNQIEIEAKANLNLVIQYKSTTSEKCFHNGIIRVQACKDVQVNIIILNLLNGQSQHFEAIENHVEENAKLTYTIIDIGAGYSISNYYSNLCGKNAKNSLNTIYIAGKDQVKDLNYIAELRGQKTNMNIEVEGALKDNAKKHFKGTIDFKQGCTKAVGNENEYCMLLSKEAKSMALPMLLCTEEDVEGNHSTASGKVDEKELFYIMSRGISYQEAIKLIVKAKFNKVIENIYNQELQAQILAEIDERLE